MILRRKVSNWMVENRREVSALRLLVSVSSAAEASAAIAGGADVIDAKDPRAGALGAVSCEVLREIHAAVAGLLPVTAALGDAADEAATERAARAFAGTGVSLVKVGFAGINSAGRAATLLAAAVRGARAGKSSAGAPAGVVAVAYADADRLESIPPQALMDIAARAGAEGVLLDTADKAGPGLRGLIAAEALAAWVRRAHEAGLFVALAGKLTAGDLRFVRDAGADIAGVRGAACDGGRAGCVSTEKVALLRTMCGPAKAGHYVRHDDTDVRSVRL